MSAARFANVRIIVNPASGRRQGFLGQVNEVLHPAGVHWDVRITNGPGDATELARAAVADGVDVVGVYGGNGTVAAVAEGMQGAASPLWILAGGTGNGTAGELGVPRSVTASARMLVDPEARVECIDLGRVGSRVFLLRAGIGLIAEIDRRASAEIKSRVGGLAYVTAGMDVLRSSEPLGYRVTVDGKTVERDAFVCIIANGGGFGRMGVLAEGVSMTDGMLDVFLYGREETEDLLAAFMRTGGPFETLSLDVPPVGSGRRVRVETEMPQAAVADGEDAGVTPLGVEVLPGAINVLLPSSTQGHARPTRPPRPPWASHPDR